MFVSADREVSIGIKPLPQVAFNFFENCHFGGKFEQ
jgi:hypothetical protein